MMIKKLITLAFAAVFLFSNLYSEEKQDGSKNKNPQTSSLQHEITVTANLTVTPRKEIASSITIITKKELERIKRTNVLEVLQSVPGISIIQNGPSGGAASVFLRGANSEHTLVMMDGIELNDPITPSRSYDLAHYTLENVERIEILRGPQSTLYGSDAMGGVINIITKKGHGKPNINLSARGGSYNTYGGNTEISGGTERFFYSFGFSALKSSGFSATGPADEEDLEKDGYRSTTLSGRLGYRPTKNLEFDLVLRRLYTKTDIDNFGEELNDDPNNTQHYNSFYLKCQARTLLLKNRWEQKFTISLVNFDRKHENLTDETHPFNRESGRFKSKQWQFNWQNNLFFHKDDLVMRYLLNDH